MRWEERAACKDDPHPEAWFPDGADRAARERAVRICMSCPVRSECLEDALAYERQVVDADEPARGTHGVRGAVPQNDRKRIAVAVMS